MSVKELAKCMIAINDLRAAEGASVTILCDNPEYSGAACAIEVCDDWTDYINRRFEGETVLEALVNALVAKESHDSPSDIRTPA